MAPRNVKVLAVEIDGVDLPEKEEYLLSAEDMDFAATGFTATKTTPAIQEANTRVAISPDDTTPGNLIDKISVGSTKLSKVEATPGGNETVSLDVVETNIVHNNLSGVIAKEHLDWTVDQGANNIAAENLKAVNALDLNNNLTTPAHLEGRSFYDKTNHAHVVLNDNAAVSPKLGQEEIIRVYNNSGATIIAGKPVYMTGVEPTELITTIGLAKADTQTTATVIGVTTHSISNNSYGYITKSGPLRNIDTSAFVAGDLLYLSEVTAGVFKTTQPTDGFRVAFIGCVIVSNATTGKILVSAAGAESRAADTVEAFGSMTFFDDVTPITLALDPDVWTKITTFNSKIDSGVDYVLADTVTNNRLTLGSLGGGNFLINYSILASAGANGTVTGALYLNGAIIPSTTDKASVNNNTYFTLHSACEIALSDTDFLELYIKDTSGAVDPIVEGSVIVINRLTGGQKGVDGTPGADGDITWEGDWLSQNYITNQAVSYLGSSYVCHTNTTINQAPTGTNFWDTLASKGDTGSQGIAGPQGPKDYIVGYAVDEASTSSSSYAAISRFEFPGTTIMGVPSFINVVARRSGGSSINIRIIDLTNASAVVCELTGTTTTVDAILSLGVLANLPTGAAVFELQMHRVGGGGTGYIQSVHVGF